MRKRRFAIIGSRLVALAVALLATPVPIHADAPFKVEVGRYRLQSNPWVNLHQRLMREARFEAPAPVSLSGEELARWSRTVAAYRDYLGKRSPIFDDELVRLNASLSAMDGDVTPGSIPPAAGAALKEAMPLYRAAQWSLDDRANRFWIGQAEPMLKSAGEELAEAHTKAYGVPFPRHILVDVTGFGWEFGAYTVGQGDSAHAVIASQDPGYQGYAALESLMHEPSHAIVEPNAGAIGADLSRSSRELGLKPMANLWHAVLFYTSGELTRRALAARGILDYKPMIFGLYDGPYRGYRQALETHWQAWLDGRISREEAMRQVLKETAPAAPSAAAPPAASVKAGLEEAMRRYASLIQKADAVSVSESYTEDGELIEPGMEPLKGRAAIRGFLESSGSRRIESSEMKPEVTEVSGDGAYQWGTYAQRVVLPGKPAAEFRGRFVAQWSRQADGRWLIRRLLTQPAP